MSTHGVPRTAKGKVALLGGVCPCAQSRRGTGLAPLALVMLLGGCGGDRGEEAPAIPAVEYRRFVAVQVAGLADSAGARASALSVLQSFAKRVHARGAEAAWPA